jgi:hypothetical protein
MVPINPGSTPGPRIFGFLEFEILIFLRKIFSDRYIQKYFRFFRSLTDRSWQGLFLSVMTSEGGARIRSDIFRSLSIVLMALRLWCRKFGSQGLQFCDLYEYEYGY